MLVPQVEVGLLSVCYSPSQVGAWVNAGVFWGGHTLGARGWGGGVSVPLVMSALSSLPSVILKDYYCQDYRTPPETEGPSNVRHQSGQPLLPKLRFQDSREELGSLTLSRSDQGATHTQASQIEIVF